MITVIYSQCFTGDAKSVEATVRGESRHPDTFNATILDIEPWGFRARIHRTDAMRQDWGQRGVNMRWKANFGEFMDNCRMYFLFS